MATTAKKDKKVSENKVALEKSVLVRPRVSDKAFRIQALDQYTFDVLPNATKPQIRREVERRYGVRVLSVNVVLTHGKSFWYRGKATLKPRAKKASVTLAKGQKIETF